LLSPPLSSLPPLPSLPLPRCCPHCLRCHRCRRCRCLPCCHHCCHCRHHHHPPLLLQWLVGCCVVLKGLIRVAIVASLLPPQGLYCCSSSSSLPLPPPLVLLHVLHPHPLVVSSGSSPVTCLTLSATRSSRVVPHPPILSCCPSPRLPCAVHHPPSSCYPTPACHPSNYLDLIVVFIIPVECGCDEGHVYGLASRFISGHPWNTMTITSMWTCQSSPPPTNLFINMLGMVPVNSSRLFGYVGKLCCVSRLCFDKNGHKKINEVQIRLVLAMMRHFLTKGVRYQSDQKGMTETTAHSNG
jgi:hypothetical protein